MLLDWWEWLTLFAAQCGAMACRVCNSIPGVYLCLMRNFFFSGSDSDEEEEETKAEAKEESGSGSDSSSSDDDEEEEKDEEVCALVSISLRCLFLSLLSDVLLLCLALSGLLCPKPELFVLAGTAGCGLLLICDLYVCCLTVVVFFFA
jgi:hypothetical protein